LVGEAYPTGSFLWKDVFLFLDPWIREGYAFSLEELLQSGNHFSLELSQRMRDILSLHKTHKILTDTMRHFSIQIAENLL
jgi:hypothetical protein